MQHSFHRRAGRVYSWGGRGRGLLSSVVDTRRGPWGCQCYFLAPVGDTGVVFIVVVVDQSALTNRAGSGESKGGRVLWRVCY